MESKDLHNLPNQLHALLFSEGGSLTYKKLTQLTRADEAHIQAALATLAVKLEGSGVALVQTATEVAMVVSSDTAPAVQAALEREFSADIGDAGLEVLAIVLYRGPSTRAHIDYIRGVNTSSTIRSLLSRGLLERTGNPDDGREYMYRPTVELLAHLGARNAQELPEYEQVRQELAAFEATSSAPGQQNTAESDTITS